MKKFNDAKNYLLIGVFCLAGGILAGSKIGENYAPRPTKPLYEHETSRFDSDELDDELFIDNTNRKAIIFLKRDKGLYERASLNFERGRAWITTDAGERYDVFGGKVETPSTQPR